MMIYNSMDPWNFLFDPLAKNLLTYGGTAINNVAKDVEWRRGFGPEQIKAHRIKIAHYWHELSTDRPGFLIDTIEAIYTQSQEESLAWIPTFISAMKIAQIDGSTLAQSEAEDLTFYTDRGMPPQRASKWVRRRNSLFVSVDPSTPPSLDMCSKFFRKTTYVHVEFHLLDIHKIQESDYHYEASFALLTSWADDRPFNIFGQIGDEKIDILWSGSECNNRCFEGQCCSNFWRPTIVGENSVSIISNIDDETQGLSWPSKDTAMRYQEFTGTFKNFMDFADFPLDSQTLTMEFIVADMRTNSQTVKFVPSLSTKTNKMYNSGASGGIPAAKEAWFIDSVRIGDEVTSDGASSLMYDIGAREGNHPLSDYIQDTSNDNSNTQQTKIVFKIDVSRNPGFYYLNVILPVALLTVLSFMVFLLPPDQIGDRLAISVTLYLALIAFQVVLTNYIPPTAYQTRMHQFILWATIIMTMTVMESLTVFYVYTIMKEKSDAGIEGSTHAKGIELLLERGIKNIVKNSAKVGVTTKNSMIAENKYKESDIVVEDFNDDESLTSDEHDVVAGAASRKQNEDEIPAASAALMIAAGVSAPRPKLTRRNSTKKAVKAKEIRSKIHTIDQAW